MNDQELFEQLYKDRFPTVCAYVMSKLRTDYATAEDIASETFLRLQYKWETISPRNMQVLTAWLYTTAEHLCMDHIKKQQYRGVIYLDPTAEQEFSDQLAEVAEIHDRCDYHLLLNRIREVLSEKDWRLFVAIYVENLPQKTVMKAFRLRTEHQLYQRKSRLKQKIQKHRARLLAQDGAAYKRKESES